MTSQWLLGGDPDPIIPLLGCRFQVRETEERGADGAPTSLTTYVCPQKKVKKK